MSCKRYFQQTRVHARVDHIVNIGRDVIARCHSETGITGRRDTTIRLVDELEVTEFTGVAGDNIPRTVRRTVINDNKFQILQILFLCCQKALRKFSPL